MHPATIIGVTGDATLYCVPCARLVYGRAAIERTCATEYVESLPCDHEGNTLGVVFAGDEMDDKTCMVCGASLEGKY
jgi:hypothetical protein